MLARLTCAAFGIIMSIAFRPHFAFASVVLNEILFDPSGTDTGFEAIEIYNPGPAAIDMGGWELYPDGIGYFSFPSGFSLAGQSLATVHLRMSGANDAANLYHNTATANMGNSSGSIALFRSGGRTKDTIVDFARYHKPGSSEKKTWESTAAEAGLWPAGTYVDVSGISEGNSIGLAADGIRGSATSWTILVSPSLGGANAAAGGGSSPSPSPAPPPSPQATEGAAVPAPTPTPPPAPPPAPSLGANAGQDALTVAGAVIQFEGLAFGLDGKPLDSARFFWNFGDGSTQEKQSPTHIYHFPGTYHVNLSVQSGHYAGSDWKVVTVLPAEISITEVAPGETGFVELVNASPAEVDLGGMFLTDDKKLVFRIPFGTVVGARSAVVLPGVNTRLAPATYLNLRDARGVVLDTAEFKGLLPAGASWEREGYDFRAQPKPTPGTFAVQGTIRQTDAVVPRTNPAPSPNPSPPMSVRPAGPPPAPAGEIVSAMPSAPTPPRETAAIGSARSMPYVFFAASVILGLVTAAGIVILKRKPP